MERRRALATVAAVTFGAVAIAAAVGATTRVFNVAEASPGVGRVSPVTQPPPVVEHQVVDVEDPPVAAPAPAPAPVSGTVRAPAAGAVRSPSWVAPAPAPPPSATASTAAAAPHEPEPQEQDD